MTADIAGACNRFAFISSLQRILWILTLPIIRLDSQFLQLDPINRSHINRHQILTLQPDNRFNSTDLAERM